MANAVENSRFHLGFLHILQTNLGYVGGLLVTNHLGRPLEFQCTTPVQPNRTQEILYGPTLQPFIYAELIGKTLVERLSIKPRAILVRQEELLGLREKADIPVACLDSATDSRDLPDQTRLALGRQMLRVHQEYSDDLELFSEMQAFIPADVDMSEPLDRVKEALQEALRSSSAA